ncbi:SDR family oxidoreductase [Sciscionella sediminilitoris]|uniref:SDR family oxidoreductase n=1 Tax=Sciscionella sediminilitoris TaxID=1445613 RepID=UPI0004DF9A70|nr:SDR family oxidoreductase [Sciscionella sp. SE31]
MAQDRLSEALVVISGASSGIGAATALRFAASGARIALLARRTEKLTELAGEIGDRGGTGFPVTADVTDPESITSAIERIGAEHGRIDVLVTAAGFVSPGQDLRAWQDMVSVNVTGTLNCVHPALPYLQAAAEGPHGVADLVLISSVAGRAARPHNPVYSATKFAVNAFAEGLRQQVTENYVRVGIVEPGLVATEMTAHSWPPGAEEHEWLRAEDIADAVEYMVTRGRHAAVNEIMIRPTEQAR